MDSIRSKNAPDPVGSYPHAKKAGNLLFLSGIGPREKGTNGIPGLKVDANGKKIAHDIAAECHSVFKNVKSVLEDSGASMDDLVDVTVFLTDMKNDFPTFNKIYSEYFSKIQPCRTTVEVTSLPTPISIELKCIAVLRGK